MVSIFRLVKFETLNVGETLVTEDLEFIDELEDSLIFSQTVPEDRVFVGNFEHPLPNIIASDFDAVSIVLP